MSYKHNAFVFGALNSNKESPISHLAFRVIVPRKLSETLSPAEREWNDKALQELQDDIKFPSCLLNRPPFRLKRPEAFSATLLDRVEPVPTRRKPFTYREAVAEQKRVIAMLGLDKDKKDCDDTSETPPEEVGRMTYSRNDLYKRLGLGSLDIKLADARTRDLRPIGGEVNQCLSLTSKDIMVPTGYVRGCVVKIYNSDPQAFSVIHVEHRKGLAKDYKEGQKDAIIGELTMLFLPDRDELEKHGYDAFSGR